MADKTFVVLAAGRGTRIGRVGESLHKALVPLNGRAMLSHLFDLAPSGAKLVVCVGHRADQIREYVRLAHPTKHVTFVDVPGWDQPGAGPGASLLAAREHVEGGLVFTSCDTLWARDQTLWHTDGSWAAVAPVPVGTDLERWCRMDTRFESVVAIVDKAPGHAPWAYTGLTAVHARDLDLFWVGVVEGSLVEHERQVTGGLRALCHNKRLGAREIAWTDVGDEAAYRRAVARFSGYDWTKPNEATYVLPDEGRVVKFWANTEIAQRRIERARLLKHFVPGVIAGESMLAYAYVPGVSGYEAAARDGSAWSQRVVKWVNVNAPRVLTMSIIQEAARLFYRDKTYGRLELLSPELRRIARAGVALIDFEELVSGVVPGYPHGDLNFGNIIRSPSNHIVGLDWREDFGGLYEGDLRYDYAKLIGGTIVHWDHARVGDFRPWAEGEVHRGVFESAWPGRDVQIITALTLLNSAPLHAPPLDEVLVSRGIEVLERAL